MTRERRHAPKHMKRNEGNNAAYSSSSTVDCEKDPLQASSRVKESIHDTAETRLLIILSSIHESNGTKGRRLSRKYLQSSLFERVF